MKRITLRLMLWLFAIMLYSQASAASIESSLKTLGQTAATEKELEAALHGARHLKPAERFVIENQLRLRLAALQMQQQDFEQARNTLKQINTESPAALQASMLMAESYRLTGQPADARSWFLRTAQHFPYRAATLNGLLSAAHDAQDNNAGLSAALYSEISRQSLFALGQLDLFQESGELDPMAIIFPSHLDEAVRKTLLRRSLRHPRHNLLAQTGQLKESVTAVLALRQRHDVLNSELSELSQTLGQYQQQQQSILQQVAAGDAQLAALMAQVVPNDLGQEQVRIRQQITRLRNQQARLRAQLAFIERSQQALPAIARKLEKQLQDLYQNAQQQLSQSHAAVTDILEETVAQYRAELSDLAAEAQLQRSELLLSSK